MISSLEEVLIKENIFGNKARNLSILINHGILVPRGVAISYEYYLYYLKFRKLDKDFKRELLKKLEKYSGQFAVRSSADVEDSEFKSYAGFFKTVLDVPKKGILKAIKQIYDSGINFNSPYSNTQVRMGIIIQEMIEAEISGIIFTYDIINKNPNSLMVELCYCKCENIVSGKINPSLYIINKNSGKTILFEQGDQNVSLNRHQLDEILQNAKKIEKIFGKPQDIEFSFNSNKFYCLQSRNITTI